MTLSKTLRDQVCANLNITTPQALGYRVRKKCRIEGVADPDIGLLLVAFDDAGILVTKPRYAVPQDKLEAFQEHLNARKAQAQPQVSPLRILKKGEKPKPRGPTLLNFKGRTPTYPHIFYNRLEDEINTAYGDDRLPNAALVLSRKLIENLVYNLLQYKFGPKMLDLYFDKKSARAKDFSVLLESLKAQRSAFDPDQYDLIDKLWDLAQKFRPEANAKAHNVMEYLESISQLRKFKIPEMTQILVELISRVRS